MYPYAKYRSRGIAVPKRSTTSSTDETAKPNQSCPPPPSSRHSSSKSHSTTSTQVLPQPIEGLVQNGDRQYNTNHRRVDTTKPTKPRLPPQLSGHSPSAPHSTSAKPSRTCGCNETPLCEPGPIVREVEVQIREWLKENLEQLTVNAACTYTNLTTPGVWKDNIKRKDNNLGKYYDICDDVLADNNVRRFPCFFNVSRATFKSLRECLKCLCPRVGKARCRRVAIAVDNIAVTISHPRMSNCRYNFDEAKAECNKKCRRSADPKNRIINPTVHPEFGKVHATLKYEDEYWKIIRQASKFDQNPYRSVGEYFIREILKIRGKNSKLNEQLSSLATILGKRDTELEEYAGTAEKAIEHISNLSKQPPLTLNPGDIKTEQMKKLKAVTSISHVAASRIKIKDDDGECLNFWKARYVFSGKEAKGCFAGVALDTITGKVWNVDMTFVHDLCPRAGWKCNLTSVTKTRWEEYVEKDRYSLMAFDDKERFMPKEMGRFMPLEGILMLRRADERIPSESILLSPL